MMARLGGPADARLRARELLEGSLTSLKALGLVEFRHQVPMSGKLAGSECPLRAVGEKTGCYLVLEGSSLVILGPSLAVCKGAAKMVDKFLASPCEKLSEALEAFQPAKTGATRPFLRPAGPEVERIVEIRNLNRNRLLCCQGALIKRVQEVCKVRQITVLDNSEHPEVPKETSCLCASAARRRPSRTARVLFGSWHRTTTRPSATK
ncbi:unnamed protein product [Effrenium voratum]|uniref:Uncharacterized protein n=1 Tax=Effrenium voratum TaxID=2562239 RepID=A0AA36IMU2_9DINO|nr:unnamed protein product [Effrenium voratum]CAJ1423472.1 unnamed protein product [Effrenium voratum]